MKKTIIKTVCFLLCLALALGAVNHIFVKKGYQLSYVRNFYAQDRNTIDILVLGNSHAYQGIYTSVLWRQYGYTAYNDGGSGQPPWITYYFLKEALKRQKPELIVLETYAITYDDERDYDGDLLKSTIGMRWSANKVGAIMVSYPKEEMPGHLFEYAVYHDRYDQLEKEDFQLSSGDKGWKGTRFQIEQTFYEAPDIPLHAGAGPLMEKAELYYRKILDLAQAENIPVLAIAMPFVLTEKTQARFNRVGEIAAEYDVPFINYNELHRETGFDFATDLADEGHLNCYGGAKITTHLGAYIAAHYDLPDHRNDAAYESWETDAKTLERRQYNGEIRSEGDWKALLQKWNRDPDAVAILSFNGTGASTDPEIQELLLSLGMEVTGDQGVLFLRGGSVMDVCPAGENRRVKLGSFDLYVESVYDGDNAGLKKNRILFDKIPCLQSGMVENGMDVILFDLQTDEIVDAFETWKDSGYNGFEWKEP